MSTSPSINFNSNVLSNRDVNSPMMQNQLVDEKKSAAADAHNMEYHRQVLQSKLDQNQYVVDKLNENEERKANGENYTKKNGETEKKKNELNYFKLNGEKYISPSDTIMSPCTAKLSAYRSKQVGKNSKPRSLFAKTSAKNLAKNANGELFGQDITPSKRKNSEDENEKPVESEVESEDTEMGDADAMQE